MNQSKYKHKHYWPHAGGFVSVWRVTYDLDGDGSSTAYVAAMSADAAARFVAGSEGVTVDSIVRLSNLEIDAGVIDAVIACDQQRAAE